MWDVRVSLSAGRARDSDPCLELPRRADFALMKIVPDTVEGMDWLFNGLGTLLVGMLIGGGGCYALRSVQKRSTKQTQVAGDRSIQTQVGGDQVDK